jgi:hypothetical protein
MVDGLHTPVWNRMKKTFAIALNETQRQIRGREHGSNATNVQYKSNWNCHYEFPHIMNMS